MNTNKRFKVFVFTLLFGIGFVTWLPAQTKLVDFWQVQFCDLGNFESEKIDTLVCENDTVDVIIQFEQSYGTKPFTEQLDPDWFVEPDSCFYCFTKNIINDSTVFNDSTLVQSDLVFYVTESVYQINVRAHNETGGYSKFSDSVLYYFQNAEPPCRPVAVQVILIIE